MSLLGSSVIPMVMTHADFVVLSSKLVPLWCMSVIITDVVHWKKPSVEPIKKNKGNGSHLYYIT
jgi:hypothetical protein